MSDRFDAGTISSAIAASDGPAVCAYLTAGYPNQEAFSGVLRSVAAAADVVEVGVPFTDPMADGLTIQRASHQALEGGVTLRWILETLESMKGEIDTPILLMGYYNPFLAHGLDILGASLDAAGVSGVIVPDLPLEESGPVLDALAATGQAVVQLVTPSTPTDRLERLAGASSGFLYAVTVKGVTGGQASLDDDDLAYLRRAREISEIPVLAGFGIRNSSDVARLAPHVDGVVVGSALIEAIDNGEDPGVFVDSLRPAEVLS
ncbi:MAG: tryptophan synthase subunit alpha [Actinomycetota bacterium]|nr:tryptophan synthase subunit alpha [Actinomycetota bacterium]